MASIINASTTSTSGLVQTADASGVLQLQSNGVTGLTVGPGGLVTAANGIVMSPMTLGTSVAGEIEYDGSVPYFTPLGTQRGLIPSAQYFRLNSALVGANASTAQNVFGVGVTLSANTVYAFESYFVLVKTVGTTSHTFSYGFGGTATTNNALITLSRYGSTSALPLVPTTGGSTVLQERNSTAMTVSSGAQTSAVFTEVVTVSGTVSVATGGTFAPQYQLSAAPGGAYSTVAGSYFLIYPIGAAGANTSVGSWA